MKETANVVEIFSSIQGEGIYIGKRQLFIRFAHCNLSCDYCDTPVEEAAVKECLIEWIPGSGMVEKIANPLTTRDLVDIAERFLVKERFHHAISLTGGEPLLYAPFLKKLLPEMYGLVPLYLETNGTLYNELEHVIENVDIVSMDIKLPQSAGITAQWDNHKRFLRTANEREVFVKTVVSDRTPKEEFAMAADLVSEIDKNIPFIIQPLTVEEGMEKPADASHLFSFYEYASSCLSEVRIIPQSHKMMDIL